MIHIDFSSASVQVEPDGDPSCLALLETFETQGALSVVQYHNEASGRTETIAEDIRARSPGGRVAYEYTITEPGDYVITSGLRENNQSRIFRLHLGAVESGRMELVVQQGSTSASWVIGDHLAHHTTGDTMRFAIEIQDVVMVENAGKTEFKRQTAWDRIMEDDDAV
jgi:hypothetical protein